VAADVDGFRADFVPFWADLAVEGFALHRGMFEDRDGPGQVQVRQAGMHPSGSCLVHAPFGLVLGSCTLRARAWFMHPSGSCLVHAPFGLVLGRATVLLVTILYDGIPGPGNTSN
jgi:hypothetical protein